MEPAEVAAVGVLLIAFSLVSMRIERWPLTMPMLFVGAGLVGETTGLVDVSPDNEVIALLAEITLAVILFSDAVRIDIRRLRRYLAVPTRLLGIGLPLTIAFGAVANSFIFPELPFAQVALLAAILAPTDAALGSSVVEEEAVPVRDRLALNVESGVNDGLVVPVVAIFTAIVIEEERSTFDWVGFVVKQIGWGLAIGVIVGCLAIIGLRWSTTHSWSDTRYEQLATFAVPIVALFAASALDGNSFIAAFVAGLTFGSYGVLVTDEYPTLPVRLGAFTEDAAQLLAVVAFFVFGNVLLSDALGNLSIAILVCAVLTLTLVRMVPVWIALVGTGLAPQTRLFLGWFGPRGLASIVFGLLLLEDTESDIAVGEQLFGVIALTVTASVILHGATAAPGARWYGRWTSSAMETGEQRERAGMVMARDLTEEERQRIPPGRWSTNR